ncbi:MAG: FkbM family methyltransferase [Sideroxydans sp.]|jgi:hypothetical protein
MATIVGEFFKSLLLSQNKLLCKTTDVALVSDFISSLKPVTTNHNLIRIGGEGDGGYLVPDDLDNINGCFSPGVCEVANFELAFANRGVKCYLADYSVEAPPVQNKLFDFEKKYLGQEEDSIHITLENWVNRKAKNESDLILQMDIEGAEYEVLFDTSRETLRKFRILVIEFHRLEAIIVKHGFDLINLSFRKLLKDFEIVHIHPNNAGKVTAYKNFVIPQTMEFTFLRKDRVSSKQPTLIFPHKLDTPCAPNKADCPLPKCWYE